MRLLSDSGALRVTADDGDGSNGSRARLWKVVLQQLADLTGLDIPVCPFPPGSGKWNKIDHETFSYISMNGRGGKPLISYEVINSIAATSTRKKLKIDAEIDKNLYITGSCAWGRA